MTTLPTPSARRLTKPSWKDARLIIGVLLVLLSVVIGALAFRAADDRIGVWAASTTLTPGEPIEEGDLQRVDVQLGDASSGYIPTSQQIPVGAVVDRALGPGELLPRAAVVNAADLDVQRVPVRVDPVSLSNLTKGSTVTVLAPAAPERDEDGRRTDDDTPYEVVAEGVPVHSLPKSSGGVISSGSTAAAILVIPKDQVPQILSLDDSKRPIKLVVEAGSPEKQD